MSPNFFIKIGSLVEKKKRTLKKNGGKNIRNMGKLDREGGDIYL
jgi:hypothetical protein